jgi:hypothetical protein
VLTESVPVTPAIPAPLPASSHILNRDLPRVVENTAWPEAMPEVIDHAHASGCTGCIDAGDDYEFIECDSGVCIYSGKAPIVERSYSTAYVHCPNCGAVHIFPREHDWEPQP